MHASNLDSMGPECRGGYIYIVPDFRVKKEGHVHIWTMHMHIILIDLHIEGHTYGCFGVNVHLDAFLIRFSLS